MDSSKKITGTKLMQISAEPSMLELDVVVAGGEACCDEWERERFCYLKE